MSPIINCMALTYPFDNRDKLEEDLWDKEYDEDYEDDYNEDEEWEEEDEETVAY